LRTIKEGSRSQRQGTIASHISEDQQIDDDIQLELGQSEEEEQSSSDVPEDALIEEDEDKPIADANAPPDTTIEQLNTALETLTITSDEEDTDD